MVFVPVTLILDIAFLTTTDGMESLTEAGSVFLSNLFFTVYVLNMGIKWLDLRNIFYELYKLTTPEDETSYNQLKSDAATVKIVSITILTTVTAVFSGYLAIPYVQLYLDYKKCPNDSIPLPLLWYQWYPWSPREHPYWEVSMFFEVVRSVGMFNLFIGFDTLFSGMLIVVAGQFQLLQKYLQDLRITAELNIGLCADKVEDEIVTEMEMLLRRYVKKHKRLIQ